MSQNEWKMAKTFHNAAKKFDWVSNLANYGRIKNIYPWKGGNLIRTRKIRIFRVTWIFLISKWSQFALILLSTLVVAETQESNLAFSTNLAAMMGKNLHATSAGWVRNKLTMNKTVESIGFMLRLEGSHSVVFQKSSDLAVHLEWR